MKTLLVILLGIPFSFLVACEHEDYHSTVVWHHIMYETLIIDHKTYDPILLKNTYEKDIFYSGCQYALEHVVQHQEEVVKSTQAPQPFRVIRSLLPMKMLQKPASTMF